jgi:Fic family protein
LQVSKAEKIEISNTLNGARRKNQTIQKIISARQELENQGRKVTQKRIAEIAKLSPKTVRAHLNSELIDIDELVQMINDSVPLKNLAASMNNTCQISQ